MTAVTIHEAKTHLSRLLHRLEKGEKIIITHADKPSVMLNGFDAPSLPKRRPPKEFAKWGEKHPLPADFNDPMPDAWFETGEYPRPGKPKKH